MLTASPLLRTKCPSSSSIQFNFAFFFPLLPILGHVLSEHVSKLSNLKAYLTVATFLEKKRKYIWEQQYQAQIHTQPQRNDGVSQSNVTTSECNLNDFNA